MTQDFDVIVIGSGHNGLVAACYLARAHQNVIVVEAAATVGGMTATVAAIPEAPDHRINICSVEPGFLRATNIISELGLHRFGYREVEVDPYCARLLPDGSSLAFWRDPRRTAEEIRRFSAADADSFLAFSRTCDAILSVNLPLMTANPMRPGFRRVGRMASAALRHRRDLKRTIEMLSGPFAQVLEEYFRHPIVRDAFTVMAGGPTVGDGSGVRLIGPGFYHRWGLGRPVGGMQSLVDALVGALQREGGSVRTSSPVAEIVVNAGIATGVRLESGEVLRAKAVIAACDPRLALGELLPAGTLSPKHEARVRHIPAYAEKVTHLKVDLAFSGQLRLERHERWRADGLDLRKPTLLLGSEQASSSGYRQARAGHLPTHISVWSVIPTAADPSQAPPGADTLYNYCWPFPLEPVDGWEAIETDAGKLVLTELADYYDGLDLELGRRIENPQALAKRLRISNGCVEHVDFSPLRSGPFRPALGFGGFATPVPGLFLGSAGSHPGPGVHGIPGQLAAREVLRSIGRAK